MSPKSRRSRVIRDALPLRRSTGRLGGGTYVPSTRRRLAWFVRLVRMAFDKSCEVKNVTYRQRQGC